MLSVFERCSSLGLESISLSPTKRLERRRLPAVVILITYVLRKGVLVDRIYKKGSAQKAGPCACDMTSCLETYSRRA
jgi:hypothetical protein